MYNEMKNNLQFIYIDELRTLLENAHKVRHL